MTLTYISCSSDFYTFYVNIPLSLGCMIRKVSAEDIAIRGNGTGMEHMCPTRHFVYIFFNPVFQVSTAKNEINLFNNHVLIVAPVTFAPAGAMTPSAEFLFNTGNRLKFVIWLTFYADVWNRFSATSLWGFLVNSISTISISILMISVIRNMEMLFPSYPTLI